MPPAHVPTETPTTASAVMPRCSGNMPLARSVLPVAVAVLASLLTGCTSAKQWWQNGFKVGPNYCRPPAPVADEWIDAGHENVKTDPADNAAWWRVFQDPVLDELVDESSAQNLPLKIAGLRILEARSQRGVAAGNLFPQQQEATGAYHRSEFSENAFPFGTFPMPKMAFSTWSLGFDAAWELDFWGRFRRMIESADANLNAQVENYDDVLVLLQAEVAANYVQMRAIEERLALAHKNVALQTRTLEIIDARFRAGVVSELDVEQAKSVLAVTESLIPVLEANRRKVQNRLCTLMGMPPQNLEAELGALGAIPVVPPEVVVGIPAELLRRRPDVRRAEREAAAQSARIGVATAELYPRIAITGNIAVESEYFRDLFRWDSIAAGVGPGFRWNVLNYGRIVNNIDVEDARFRQLVLAYQETVLRANEEVEGAIVAFLREQVRVRSLQRSVAATQRAVDLALLQYEQGLIDYQRVLDTQRALVNQQDTLAESRGNVALSLIAVYKALGGGWRVRFAAGAMAQAAAPVEAEPQAGERVPTPAAPTPRSQPSPAPRA